MYLARWALILWYALFTYDVNDPGFSQATSSTDVTNGVGRLGAYTSDLLFNFFGRPAYLFTVMVLLFRLDAVPRAEGHSRPLRRWTTRCASADLSRRW